MRLTWRYLLGAVAVAAAVMGPFFSAGAAEPQQDSTVRIGLHHIIVKPMPGGGLDVNENLVLVNESAPIPAGAGKVILPITPEALDVRLGAGMEQATAQPDQGKITINSQINQGETAYSYAYSLPAQGPHVLLSVGINQPTEWLYLVTPLTGLQVSGSMEDQGVIEVSGVQYRLYAAEGLAPGDTLNLAFSAEPAAGSQGQGTGITRQSVPMFHNPGHIRFWYQSPFKGINAHLFLVILGLAVVLLVMLLIRNRQQISQQAMATDRGNGDPFLHLRQRESSLISLMGRLEQDWRQGKVTEDEYQRLRSGYKGRLLAVKKQLRGMID